MKHANEVPAVGPAPFDLWGSKGWCNQDVAGESHYVGDLQQVLTRLPGSEGELECDALLVPEPDNRFDPAAVAVHIDGRVVGYLPRDVAAQYQTVLAGLTARGLVARVPARVWGGVRIDYETNRAGRVVEKERFVASVSLALAEPHLCTPVNGQPTESHVLLPDGTAIQISGEERCMPAIEPFLRPEGEGYVYATVHEFAETSGRTVKELVEVRIDGQRVGQLTPKMSADLLPAIRHLDQRGRRTAVRAKVKGNQLKAEITVHAVRAHELPVDWLTSSALPLTGVAATNASAVPQPIPPRPTRIRFVAAPGWPSPPDGWEPPPGWAPDPAWPPAPAGWQFWAME